MKILLSLFLIINFQTILLGNGNQINFESSITKKNEKIKYNKFELIEDFKIFNDIGEEQVHIKNKYYDGKKLKKRIHYKDGLVHGIVKTFFMSGNLKLIEYYDNGIKVGVDKKYSGNDTFIEEVYFKNKQGDLEFKPRVSFSKPLIVSVPINEFVNEFRYLSIKLSIVIGYLEGENEKINLKEVLIKENYLNNITNFIPYIKDLINTIFFSYNDLKLNGKGVRKKLKTQLLKEINMALETNHIKPRVKKVLITSLVFSN